MKKEKYWRAADGIELNALNVAGHQVVKEEDGEKIVLERIGGRPELSVGYGRSRE